jgi:hypothetical protein
MMRSDVAAIVVWVAVAASGCGGSAPEQAATGGPAVPGASIPPPGVVVKQFLEAVKAADHLAADQLLTPAARAESEKSGMSVAPPGSATASFEVGDVEYLKEAGGGAHVASKWSDEVDGENRTDTIVWILRKEAEGWRIAGMATKVFEDEPPLILNFENHEEMQLKQSMVEAELERRSGAAIEEAKAAAPPVNKVR